MKSLEKFLLKLGPLAHGGHYASCKGPFSRKAALKTLLGTSFQPEVLLKKEKAVAGQNLMTSCKISISFQSELVFTPQLG